PEAEPHGRRARHHAHAEARTRPAQYSQSGADFYGVNFSCCGPSCALSASADATLKPRTLSASCCETAPAASTAMIKRAPLNDVQCVQRVRREHAETDKSDAGQRQQTRNPGERDHAGDDGGRGQHDGDLERPGSKLEIMI